jgi:hypothetical protein
MSDLDKQVGFSWGTVVAERIIYQSRIEHPQGGADCEELRQLAAERSRDTTTMLFSNPGIRRRVNTSRDDFRDAVLRGIRSQFGAACDCRLRKRAR